MKILINAYSCDPNRGREQGRGWNYPINIAKLGHQVWVLTRPDNQVVIEPALQQISLPNLHFIYVDYPTWVESLLETLLPKSRWLRRRSWQIRYLTWQNQAYKVALDLDKKHDFDLAHHITMGVITGGSELWRLGKPFIMGPVGGGQIAPPTFKKYFGNAWVAESMRSFFIKHVVQFNLPLRQTMSHANLVLASNQDTADLAKRLGARKAEVFLDIGLPESRFMQKVEIRSQNSCLQLLWVAVLEPRKGLHFAFEALSQMKASIPFRLTILGSGSQKEMLPRLARAFGLEDKIHWRGQVEWQEVFQAYRNNDVLIFPSLRDTSGAQLLEAMSQGMPIITLNHHGAKDIVPENCGIKVPVVNPLQTVRLFAEAVEYMYANPEKRFRMGQNAYRFATTQSWENRAVKLTQYYKKFLNLEKLDPRSH